MKRIFTGVLLFGISTTSPLHAFGFTPGSNWGVPMMNWGNVPTWNNGQTTNWSNAPTWNAPMTNWGTPIPWNTNTNNWGNTQSWSPFNFGNNNSWPTFTMPNINWQNQNMPGWNNYPPPTAGNHMNNRMPAIIYQPVIPMRVIPTPNSAATGATPTPLSRLPQITKPMMTIPEQPTIPLSTALPPISPEPLVMEQTVSPQPQAPVEILKTADKKQQEAATNSARQGGPVFPDPDDMPPEIKEIQE